MALRQTSIQEGVMRIFLAVVTAAALASANAASAQRLDLSTVTCKQFLESGKENIGLVLMWLHGYWTDEDDPPIVDFGRLQTDAEKLGAYCAQNPDNGLMTAAEAVLE
jgi:acid stress chaperone HdeB